MTVRVPRFWTGCWRDDLLPNGHAMARAAERHRKPAQSSQATPGTSCVQGVSDCRHFQNLIGHVAGPGIRSSVFSGRLGGEVGVI